MKSKSALRLGLSLFVCFSLLIGADAFLPDMLTLYPEWFALLFDVTAMMLPIILLHFLMPKKEVFRPKLKPANFTAERVFFTICMGLFAACIRFFIDYLVYRIRHTDNLSLRFAILDLPFGNAVSLVALLAVIVLPAFFEGLYLRGYIQTFLSEYISTRPVLIVMSCITAMLYGSLPQFPGALLFAFFLSWLTFSFGSFWYSVIAQAAATALYLFFNWLLEEFTVYGILRTLPACALLLALFFLYMALRTAERLSLRQAFKKLHYVQHSDYSLSKFAGNAAALAFLFVFIAKALIGIF